MKNCFRITTTFLVLCLFAKNSYSQAVFSIDSLKISDVFWLCQKDVWIEGFAYGPCLKMLFSIKNNGNDTIKINSDAIKLHLEYGCKIARRTKNIIVYFSESDTMLVIPPDSTIVFWGQTFFYGIDGDITTDMNYKFVNFLPSITKIIANAKAIIAIPGFNKMEESFKNCFTDKYLFHDGTFRESIYQKGK